MRSPSRLHQNNTQNNTKKNKKENLAGKIERLGVVFRNSRGKISA